MPKTMIVIHLAIAYGSMAQPPVVTTGLDGLCSGNQCGPVERGLHAFLDREVAGFGGNGRACADCHMPINSFQLSPASAEARYQSLVFRRQFDPKADDPLFRPIDADDFRIHGAKASDFTTLRRNGLIRITLPLPANVKLIDPATNQPSTETFVDVWRAVPSVNNVALTGPDGHVFVPRGPNPRGRLPVGCPDHHSPGSGAFGFHRPRPGTEDAYPPNP